MESVGGDAKRIGSPVMCEPPMLQVFKKRLPRRRIESRSHRCVSSAKARCLAGRWGSEKAGSART